MNDDLGVMIYQMFRMVSSFSHTLDCFLRWSTATHYYWGRLL